MTIYTKKYRKIWESHHGTIPKDSLGRSYEIHHIDGNHSNNDITNLKCVTIQEHYDIHYAQGDWAAAALIALRIKMDPELIRNLSQMAALEEVKNGTHHLMKRSDGSSVASDAVKAGTHHLMKRSDGSSVSSDLVKSGRHNSNIKIQCPVCFTVCSAPNAKRWHFDNCKSLIEYNGVIYKNWESLLNNTGISSNLYKKYYDTGIDPKDKIGKRGGNKSPFKKIEYNGVVYTGWKELKEKTGISSKLYNKYYGTEIDPKDRINCVGFKYIKP